MTLLLLLDSNDTPVAVTASTSCAVSVTTHDANRDGAQLEQIDKNVGQGGQAALRRPVSAEPGLAYWWAGGCAKKVRVDFAGGLAKFLT